MIQLINADKLIVGENIISKENQAIYNSKRILLVYLNHMILSLMVSEHLLYHIMKLNLILI